MWCLVAIDFPVKQTENVSLTILSGGSIQDMLLASFCLF